MPKKKKQQKLKFNLKGVELLQKEVKPFGNTGHIYLPKKLVGKSVYVVVE